MSTDSALHDLAIAVDLAVVDRDTANLIIARAHAYARAVALGADVPDPDGGHLASQLASARQALKAALDAYLPDPRGEEPIVNAAEQIALASAVLNVAAVASIHDDQHATLQRWAWQRHSERHDRLCWTRGQLEDYLAAPDSYHADPLLCSCYQALDPVIRLHVAHGASLTRVEQPA